MTIGKLVRAFACVSTLLGAACTRDPVIPVLGAIANDPTQSEGDRVVAAMGLRNHIPGYDRAVNEQTARVIRRLNAPESVPSICRANEDDHVICTRIGDQTSDVEAPAQRRLTLTEIARDLQEAAERTARAASQEASSSPAVVAVANSLAAAAAQALPRLVGGSGSFSTGP